MPSRILRLVPGIPKFSSSALSRVPSPETLGDELLKGCEHSTRHHRAVKC